MKSVSRPDIVIQYPPDFDGELWIEVNTENNQYCQSIQNTEFRFIVSTMDSSSPWEILVKTAKEILDQDQRRKG